MRLLEIDTLKRAFKFPVIVLTLLTFSTSTSPSGKFLFYRFLVFLTFSITVLYRVSLLFNSEAENDRQQQREVLQAESVFSVIDWVFAVVVMVFMTYQVLKKKSLKVFELLAKVDKIFTSICRVKIDYTKSFIINCTAMSLLLIFYAIFTAFVGFKRSEFVFIIYDAFTTFIGTLFLLLPMLIILIYLEILQRLKLLRKLLSRKAKVSNYENTLRELDNLQTITQVLFEAVRNLSDFFGMEILLIFGRFIET